MRLRRRLQLFFNATRLPQLVTSTLCHPGGRNPATSFLRSFLRWSDRWTCTAGRKLSVASGFFRRCGRRKRTGRQIGNESRGLPRLAGIQSRRNRAVLHNFTKFSASLRNLIINNPCHQLISPVRRVARAQEREGERHLGIFNYAMLSLIYVIDTSRQKASGKDTKHAEYATRRAPTANRDLSKRY